MNLQKKILAVIPARGGSKGIPRKNLRMLIGKPLIRYSIENACQSNYITDVVVSSDSDEILKIAESAGVMPLRRSASLAHDTVTLDPVIYDAVIQTEQKKHIIYDLVITMQPTSPLLSVATLDRAIESFLESDKDSYISVVNRSHLSWRKGPTGFIPNYAKRVNRQQLEPFYFETGAFFISRRNVVTENDRLGKKISIFEIPEKEAVDVDTPEDWLLCEHLLSQKKICFCIADDQLEEDLAFAINCRNLSYSLISSEISFVCASKNEKIKSLIENSYFFAKFCSFEEIERVIDIISPDILICNTKIPVLKNLKSSRVFSGVINRNPEKEEIFFGDAKTAANDFERVFGLERIKKIIGE